MFKRIACLAILCAAAISFLPARADIPIVKFKGTLAASGDSVILPLAGQSTCSMVTSGTWVGTVTPKGSSDAGATYTTVGPIGAQTSNGTFGGDVSPYTTNFKITFTRTSGTLGYFISCTGAVSTANVTVTAANVTVVNTPGVNVQNFPAPQSSINVNTPAPCTASTCNTTISLSGATPTPLPVTTPAPQASIVVNQGTSPFITANQQADSSPTGTLTTNGDAVTITNLSGIRAVGLTTTGTWTGTVSVQGNVDGTTWANIQGYQTGSVALAGPTFTTNKTNWVFPVGGLKQFRVTATASMTGTVNVSLYASNAIPMGAGGMIVGAIIQDSVGTSAATGSFPGADNYTPNQNSLLVSSTLYVYDGTFMQRMMGCPNVANVNISTATTTSLVAVSGSTNVYVCSYALYIVGGTLPSFQFEYGTGAACVTTQVVIGGTFGGVAGAVGEYFPSPPVNAIGYLFKTPAAKALCLVSGGTSPNIQGYVTYGQYAGP